MKESKKLARVLESVLAIGNAMNSGGGRAVAGFTLDSLLKLTTTRSADKKTTVLDYLCRMVEKKHGEDLLRFPDEISAVAGASLHKVGKISLSTH